MNLAILGGIGWQELLLIAFIALLLFGGKRIPEVMRSLGRGIGQFKSGLSDDPTKVSEETDQLDDAKQETNKIESETKAG